MYSNNRGYPTELRESNVMARVFVWMSVALAISGVTAYGTAHSPALLNVIFTQRWVLGALFISQLALVMTLSLAITRLSSTVAFGLFGLYSVLMGLTLSVVFLVYTQNSVFATFLVAAGMFGAMALYGFLTRADLTSLGSFGLMVIIGLIIAGLVNLYFKSEMFQFITSVIGVFVFTLLTAYDVQRIKQQSKELFADQESLSKIALLGALTLYLDFINLFVYLLNIMGRKRE